MRHVAVFILVSAAALGNTVLGAQAPDQKPAAPATPAAAAARPPMRNVGTMSDLMVKILYPASDALFYIETRTPKTDAEWTVLEGQALMVAEMGNLMMLPGRARDQKQWMADSKLLVDAGAAALAAAKKKDVAAVVALSDQLYESCTSCHSHYRPGYGKKPPSP
jgi:cytochrome c556